jgi:hypothetical protein
LRQARDMLEIEAVLEPLESLLDAPALVVQITEQASRETDHIDQVGGTKPEQYAQARTGAGNSQTLQNELLEQQYGNHLNAGAQGQPGRANPHLEAVGARHRAAHV